MNTERLLAHYEKISDTSDAIPRLRRLILDLALRGKLVDQDPHDEPAPELRKHIVRVQLSQADLPPNWCRTTVGTVLNFNYGKGLKASQRSNHASIPVYGSNGVVAYTDKPLTTRPSVIVGRKGSAGALNLCEGPSWTTDVAYYVEAPSFLALRFLHDTLAVLRLEKLGKGVKPGLSRSDAYEQIFCVPPLAEQHRIVAKVDELMKLCDQLEAAQTDREGTRNRLAVASLVRLNAPDPNADTFHSHAAFALQNLTHLTTRPDQIAAVRQTILNLAVFGKLTRQDSEEERRNQRQLRPTDKAGRFVSREFEDRAKLFNTPLNWTIEPLSRVASHVVDCPHTTPRWTITGILCIRTNQVKAGYLDLSAPYFVSEDTYRVRVKRLEPKQCDVLYIREGGILGVACLVPPNTRLCLGQRLMLIRVTSALVPKFLELCLNSSWIKDFAAEKTTGGAAPRVNMSTIRSYPIPIPPLAEQHRIIAKVDELIVLCNQLEKNLTNDTEIRLRLLDAVLHEALARGTEPKTTAGRLDYTSGAGQRM